MIVAHRLQGDGSVVVWESLKCVLGFIGIAFQRFELFLLVRDVVLASLGPSDLVFGGAESLALFASDPRRHGFLEVLRDGVEVEASRHLSADLTR